ncbi:MAG: glucosyltransferase domain-containing protein [Lachnospiraceae bacterium]|nr:glucosyltransferase domain-containing protein [Lachnospiraceae bacterium]
MLEKERLERYQFILLSALMWGLCAHGMAFFNKYSFHDDASLFTLGGTYYLGRWMLGILGDLNTWLFGSTYYSLPLFNGILTILFIALSAMVLTDLFEIRNRWLMAALTGVLVVFPMITSGFGYMFTMPYYFFGTLLGVLGACLSCRTGKWYLYLAGLLLMACGVGTYQAMIPVFVSIILFYALMQTVKKEAAQWRDFFYIACRSVLSCGGFMAIYFVIMKLSLKLTGNTLSDYQGISTLGSTSLKGYIKRVLVAYREFFCPTDAVSANMYPFSSDVVYRLILILALIGTANLLYCCFRKNRMLCLQALVFVLCIPLAVNFIYVMCEADTVDSLMVYGQAMFYVYFAWLLEAGFLPEFSAGKIGGKVRRALPVLSIGLLLLLNVMYVRFDNICYLKAEVMQSEGISYFTMLATQIKSVEGFTDETPVVYVNEFAKYDYTSGSIGLPEFKEIELIPYDSSSILNNYAWRITMKIWCNFDPETLDASAYADLPEVQEMPSYPDSGSIQMLDGVIVVKF